MTGYLAPLVRVEGGEAGARLARPTDVPTRPDPPLRLQHADVAPTADAPRVLGAAGTGMTGMAAQRGDASPSSPIRWSTNCRAPRPERPLCQEAHCRARRRSSSSGRSMPARRARWRAIARYCS